MYKYYMYWYVWYMETLHVSVKAVLAINVFDRQKFHIWLEDDTKTICVFDW